MYRKVMGLSRDTFYRYKSAVVSGGVEALFDKTRRKPNHKNRVDEAIELEVRDYAIEYPGLPRYFLCGNTQRRWSYLPTNLC
ncbi:transposase (ISSod13) [Legionella maceachernii]|uniref:Transposase (ISSod13) n=1 Tax=Legionella maceachernii TaxID=466 RepID=A0A0W0WDY7_9GAMM|nr:transposase (ISSod13) [Legionella maceachernii]SJZ97620.1 Winged helix-turn helix [Legionella maceachernii]SUP01085.1 Uncharacterised protein [Legionella maceachernii]